MSRGLVIASLGAAIIAAAVLSKTSRESGGVAADIYAPDFAALVPAIGGQIKALADLGNLKPAQSQTVQGKLSRAQAVNLAASLDAAHFGGFFGRSSLTPDRIATLWRIESGLNPSAINPSDPRGGSFGLGQVQAGIASADYGVSNPYDLLQPETGALVSMRHLKFTHDYLAQNLDPSVSLASWLQAYNAGAPGYVRGIRAPQYLLKFGLGSIV